MARVPTVGETVARLELVKALEHQALTAELFGRGRDALVAATSEVDARQIAAAMSRFGDQLLPLARTLVAARQSAARRKGIELFAAAANPDTVAELEAAKAADRSKALHRDYDHAIRRIRKRAGDRARPAIDPRDRAVDPVARLEALERMPLDAFQALIGVAHRSWARHHALPTLDFDRDGRRALSIEGATWHVVHQHGELGLERPDGTRARGLPRTASPAVKALVKTLKKSVAEVHATRAARLHELLVTGDTTVAWLLWLLHLEHPLRDHHAGQLVFESSKGRGWRDFTVAEDGRGLVDAAGTPVEVPPDAPVRLAHPAELDPAALARWRARADQLAWRPPIDQLGRPIHRAGDDAALDALVASLAPVPSTTLARRLTQLGFERGEVEHGLVADRTRGLGDDATLVVRHSAMPVRQAELTPSHQTTLRRAWLLHRGKPLAPTRARARAYAEAVTFLLALAG